MKKFVIKALCVIMCAVSVLFCFASCSKDPYEYKLSDYINVPDDLSAITVSHNEILKAVQDEILSLRKNKATKEVTQDAAASGDIVKISFSCYKNDVLLEDLSDDDCTLILGEGKYPAELESSLVGMMVGMKFDEITVKLTESFKSLQLEGSVVKYSGEVKQVEKVVLPEYNDAFVQSISSYQTTGEYEEYLYEKMRENLIFDAFIKTSVVKLYPVDELQAYTTSFVKYYTEKAEQSGLTLEQYAAKKFFINITDFHLKADEYAKKLVKEEMLLYTLARRYELDLTDDEYNQGAQKYLTEYGVASVSALESKFGTEYVRQTVLMDKVLAHMATLIPVTDVPVSPSAPAV